MIEVFADISCPFTHVGLRRLIERRDQIGSTAVVHVKAWPLELVNGEPLSGPLVAEKVVALRSQVAPDLFRGFDPDHFPATTLPAMALEAAAYRRSPEVGERVSLALRDALFEEGRNIALPETLAEIGGAHDLAASPEDDSAVIAAWHEGQRLGVTGSPYFFVEDTGFFCPSLDITRSGGELHIRRDVEHLEQFLELALG
ncbi:MAG: DsbA family oxidoreductase [Acidimicrobiia bacterium]